LIDYESVEKGIMPHGFPPGRLDEKKLYLYTEVRISGGH